MKTTLLDVGRDNVEHEEIDISQAQLIADYGQGQTTSDLPRGEVIRLMASCATRAVKAMFENGDIFAVISAGVRNPYIPRCRIEPQLISRSIGQWRDYAGGAGDA